MRARRPTVQVEQGERRTDPVFWVGLASCAGAIGTAASAAVPCALAAGAAAILLFRRGARVAAILAALALFVGLLRAGRALRASEDAFAAAHAVPASGDDRWWPSTCPLSGVVVSSPVLTGGAVRIDLGSVELGCRDRPLALTAGRVALYVELDGDVAPVFARGDRLAAIASLAPPYRFANEGTGDPGPRLARRGVVLSGSAHGAVIERDGRGLASAIDHVRAHLRLRILRSFPDETAPMARALVLGEDDLADDDERAFRQSGLAHLLAVSGMHLVLVVMGLAGAIRAGLARTRLAASLDVARLAPAVALPAAWLYADLAGASGSALRAAWMCSVLLLGRALGRRSSPWRALGLSLVAMSALDPLVVFDVSFVLSAFATIGIVTLGKPIETVLARVPALVRKPLATTAAATVTCAPVLATLSPSLPAGGLIANVVAVPLGEALALPLCLLHALASPWPAVEAGCAASASGALLAVRALARVFARTAIAVPSPTTEQLGAMALVALGLALGRPRHRRLVVVLGLAAISSLELRARARGAPRGELRVTFLDVGQGDAALVDLPDGSAMLVDGGGLVGSPLDVGERVVRAVLAARRRTSLGAVVLTHPHPDHYLGLAAAIRAAPPQSFWDNGQGEAEGLGGAYAGLLAELRQHGTPILRPTALCGTHAIGGALVDVLAPCPTASPDDAPNDNSFVIRVRFGRRAILLVGDAERSEEAELLRLPPELLRADVLKVGHHGSRSSSSPAFVAAVSPTVAVVSCGVRNRFGHPHPRTEDTLRSVGARLLRTDRDGSVTITTDGIGLEVQMLRDRCDGCDR